MKKNVRLALFLAMLAAMLVMTAVFASAAAVDVDTAEEFTTAIANGGEINLTADIEIGSSIAITKDTTLTGTGTITYTGAEYLFVTSGTAAVTFDGVKVTTATGGILQMTGSGTIEVSGVSFSITAGTKYIFNPLAGSCTGVINVRDGQFTSVGSIWLVGGGNTKTDFVGNIYGGTYEITGSSAMLNSNNDGFLRIYGGTFTGNGTGALLYVNDAQASIEVYGGTFVQNGTQSLIVKNNGTLLISSQDGYDAPDFTMNGNNHMIKVVRYSYSGRGVDYHVTIEAGSFMQASPYSIVRSAPDADYKTTTEHIIIKGGTFVSEAPVVSNSNAQGSLIYVSNYHTLTISDGSFISNGGAHIIDFSTATEVTPAFVSISGGTFIQNGSGCVLNLRNASRYAEGITLEDGSKVGVHITGGIFRGSATTAALVNAGGAKIGIDNGSFTASNGSVISMADNDVISEVIINGGSFTATGTANVLKYSPSDYSRKDNNYSATNDRPAGYCITRPLTVNGGTFTAEEGYALHLGSLKLKAACDVIVNGGTFSSEGESVIYVSSPSALATLTITGGTFKLLESDKGGAVLATGFYARTESGYMYDNPTTDLYLPTKAKITITGGLFVDQRTGNNQVIDVSIGNATVSIKNAVLLTHERQAYFYLTADAETSAAVTMRAPTCLYGGATYYMWMTTPVTDTTMAPVLDDGAGVRTVTDSEGIRFTSTVSPAAVALLEAKAKELGVTVEYGTLIAPADYVAAAGAFTLTALNDYVASHADVFGGDTTRVYVNIPAIKSLEGDATTGVSFSGALIDLKTTNYTRVLAAVSYAKVGNNYYYGSYDPIVNARSMAEVAEAALKDVGTLGSYNEKGKLYTTASLYRPFDTGIGSIYSATVQQVLQNYCGLEALTAASVKPTQFAMVYDTDAASMVTNYAQLLASALGITTVNGSATTSEILIGETGRTETATAKAKIRGEGYYVGVINGKIVLVGTSDALTYQAMLAFAEQCGPTTVSLAESIVSDVTIYNAHNAYFVYPTVRDGNIAYGFNGDYTHSDKDGDGNAYEVGYHIGFVTPGYRKEMNEFSVDYPVKAIVDLYNWVRGVDANSLAWDQRDQCKNPTQSVVVTDALATTGLKVHVGITNSEITTDFLAYLEKEYGVNGYGYRIENGEVHILAFNDTVLRQAVALFMADLAEFADGNGGYAIPATLCYTKAAAAETAWIADAPLPELALDGALDLHNGAYQYHYTGEGVNLAAFNTYCAELVSSGYSLYMQNDNVEGSYFRTYVNGSKTRMIHVIYAAFAHAANQPISAGRSDMLSDMFSPTLRVIVADVDGTNINLLPEAWLNPQSYTKKTETRITSVNIDNASIGNCYVITLEDGTFVVMDCGGGGDDSASADTLYNVLLELHTEINGVPSESNPITIAAYITSHTHNDHIVVFQTFADKYVEAAYGKYDGERDYFVKLNAVVGNFISDDEAYNSTNPNITLGRNDLGTDDWFRNVTGRSGSILNYSTTYTPVPYYKVQTGQRFYIGNVEFEALYTHGDTYPWGLVRFNNSSTVFRTAIYNGGDVNTDVSSLNTSGSKTTSIWLGDVEYRGSRVMRAMYGKYLKSDTVQIAHHAGNGSEGELYELINASIVFLPSNFDRVHGNFTSASNVGIVNRMWLGGTNWQYIILLDEYNVTVTVTADGPQMALADLVNTADTSDEYGDDDCDGVTLKYGKFIATRSTVDQLGVGLDVLYPPKKDDFGSASGFSTEEADILSNN